MQPAVHPAVVFLRELEQPEAYQDHAEEERGERELVDEGVEEYDRDQDEPLPEEAVPGAHFCSSRTSELCKLKAKCVRQSYDER